MFVIFYSSVIGNESSTAESLQPESNKENLLREGLLHCKITLVDGKVISLILKMKYRHAPLLIQYPHFTAAPKIV
jgi:hypothetical protein